jgi:hypothetical protein
MSINCEHVELSITDKTEQLYSDTSSLLLLKSTWNSIEIQTNLDQRLLINTSHWTIEFDHSQYSISKERNSLQTMYCIYFRNTRLFKMATS